MSVALAERTASTIARAGFVPTVVSNDQDVARWAADMSLQLMEEDEVEVRHSPGYSSQPTGLNRAAHQVSDAALAVGRPWLIIHADLPNLSAADIRRLTDVLRNGWTVLSPSYDGGTSALGSIGPISFRYGPLSFHRHLGAVAGTPHRVVWSPGLAFDLDAPSDLETAARAPGTSWLREIVATTPHRHGGS